jgi:hypothetical protein
VRAAALGSDNALTAAVAPRRLVPWRRLAAPRRAATRPSRPSLTLPCFRPRRPPSPHSSLPSSLPPDFPFGKGGFDVSRGGSGCYHADQQMNPGPYRPLYLWGLHVGGDF